MSPSTATVAPMAHSGDAQVNRERSFLSVCTVIRTLPPAGLFVETSTRTDASESGSAPSAARSPSRRGRRRGRPSTGSAQSAAMRSSSAQSASPSSRPNSPASSPLSGKRAARRASPDWPAASAERRAHPGRRPRQRCCTSAFRADPRRNSPPGQASRVSSDAASSQALTAETPRLGAYRPAGDRPSHRRPPRRAAC